LAARAAFNACQVEFGLYLLEAGFFKQGSDRCGLIPAVFDEQPAAYFQVIGPVLNDVSDVLEAIGATGQGLKGFVGQFCQMGVMVFNVGRIGHQHIEFALNLREPMTLLKADLECQIVGILGCQAQSGKSG